MHKSISARLLSILTGTAMLLSGASALPAMADAGEDPGTVSESEKVFPDPETLTPNEVNFAKALQLS
ncbi:MAG: hypothetical protein IJ595_01510, partial [Oscillospiraceae bacterium]|nr:hypothetical protein [Oscillospiraceae bacterium]